MGLAEIGDEIGISLSSNFCIFLTKYKLIFLESTHTHTHG